MLVEIRWCLRCTKDICASTSGWCVCVAVGVVLIVFIVAVIAWLLALVSVVSRITTPEASIISLFIVCRVGAAFLSSVSKPVAVIAEETISLVVLSALSTLGPLAKIRFGFGVGDYGVGTGVSLTVPFPLVLA